MKTLAKRTVLALALIFTLAAASQALAGNPYGGQWQGQMGGAQWQGQMGGYGYQPAIPTYNYNSNQNVNINVNRNYNGNGNYGYGYGYTPSCPVYVYPRYHTVCRW
jgi:hypothetical protein